MSTQDTLKEVVALCKRRGFIFPGSDLYGGFANTYSYGPHGATLKQQVKALWWKEFVEKRPDMVGIDGPILLHPMAWKASGHIDGFSDLLVDCKECKARLRVDHLIEKEAGIDVEGMAPEKIDLILAEHKIHCPRCGKMNWTGVRHFNLMFQTAMSKTSDGQSETAYLRPETAQAIFLEFKNIINTMRVKVPFGIAQIGKAFRNEITPGNFLFRTIEFEQMEIEYFIRAEEWEKHFEHWMEQMVRFCDLVGLSRENLTIYEHPSEKLSHYSKRTADVLYSFPFGKSELYGLAYRTDFDLSRHAEFSRTTIVYRDPETNETFTPHVIEPSFGVDRTILAILCQAYDVEDLADGDQRTVLRFVPRIAPVQVAIFPLVKKGGLSEKAYEIYRHYLGSYRVEYDESGAIGKRYRRQDEIGTPFCLTVDFQTLEDQSVTIRHRDSMAQERIFLDQLDGWLFERCR